MRHSLQRLHIGGDVLAGDAVAARRRQNQLALLVAQRAGEPVDLGLGHDLDGRRVDAREILRAAEEVAHAGEEGAHVLLVEGVVERQHRLRMRDLGEARGGRGADAPARAVDADEIGEALLERGVAPPQRVVFRVGNRRRVLLVISAVVLGDGLGQALELFPGLRRRQLRDRRRLGAARHGRAPAIRLAAAARASAVTALPDSMRAISSRRSSAVSSSTRVKVRACACCLATRQ